MMDNITATLVSNDGINCNMSDGLNINCEIEKPVDKFEIEQRSVSFTDNLTSRDYLIGLGEGEELIGIKSIKMRGTSSSRTLASYYMVLKRN